LRLLVASYLLLLLGVCVCIYGPGERFWPSTLILFGPRWVLAVPIFVLGIAAVRVDWRWLIPLGASGLLLAGPVWGFSVPWRRLWPGKSPEVTLRLLTWNVDGDAVDQATLARVLDAEQPDVVVLVECEQNLLAVRSHWYRHDDDQNCLLSRWPILQVASRDRKDVWAQGGSGEIVRYALQTGTGIVYLTSVHLETPREGLEALLHGPRSGAAVLAAKNQQRVREMRLAHDWANQASGSARIVAGDFNAPPESDLMREYWSDYQNCFGVAGWGFGHTKHTRTIGVRIDHVLASNDWRCVSAHVLPTAASDHDPLVVDLHLETGRSGNGP
jgi:endonuclease/exonuclease/phosphatase (EEP) superfamily protein YafD